MPPAQRRYCSTERLVEPVLLAQERDLLRIDRFALRLQLGDVALEIVAGRQLDDGEDDDADRDQRRDHQQQRRLHDVAQHQRGSCGSSQNVSGWYMPKYAPGSQL